MNTHDAPSMHNSDDPAWYGVPHSSPYTHPSQQQPMMPYESPWSTPSVSYSPWPQPPPLSAPSIWPAPPPNSNPWDGSSPYNGGQYNYGSSPRDAWSEPPKSPWSSTTPAGAMNSTLGQPISPGYFGAASQLPSFRDTSNPWNGMIRSTSEQSAAPQYTTFADRPGWELTRSRSAGADYKRFHAPNRTPIPSHRIPDTPNPKNLVTRPKDWRPNYNPRSSFLSAIPGLPSALKHHSDVEEYTDPTKRRLSSLVEFNSGQPSFSHDLRLNPLHPMTPIQFNNQGQSRHPLSTIELSQFAVTPPTNFLRVFHPRLPWYIDIHSDPDSITVGGILEETHLQLMQSILPRHYWNEALSDSDRNEIAMAYHKRVTQITGGGEKGILWIDFLCDEVIFQGFTRAKGGLLELKTRKVNAS